MVNRRELIKWASVALGTGLSASLQQALAAGVDSTGKHDFFTVEQATMVSVISELIIPTTDTPGAIAAGVPDFIEAMVADWYTAGEREIFMMGLAQLDKHCLTQYKTVFSHCDAVQQSSALSWSAAWVATHRFSRKLKSLQCSVITPQKLVPPRNCVTTPCRWLTTAMLIFLTLAGSGLTKE